MRMKALRPFVQSYHFGLRLPNKIKLFYLGPITVIWADICVQSFIYFIFALRRPLSGKRHFRQGCNQCRSLPVSSLFIRCTFLLLLLLLFRRANILKGIRCCCCFNEKNNCEDQNNGKEILLLLLGSSSEAQQSKELAPKYL